MIGRLHGTLLVKRPPQLLVDVGGVGYELDASLTTCYDLPEVGQTVTLHTHLVVREDAHLLYGFASEQERATFRDLIRINGVGAKVALAILSGMSTAELARCVAESDTAALVRLPGIGKKTAERLIVEMRDRLKDVAPAGPTALPAGAPLLQASDARGDAESALIALGYKAQEVARMIKAVANDDMSSEDIIRAALKGAAK